MQTVKSPGKSPMRLGERGLASDNPRVQLPESAMSSVATRRLSPLDRILVEAQRALETALGAPPAARPYPATAADPVLPELERRLGVEGVLAGFSAQAMPAA